MCFFDGIASYSRIVPIVLDALWGDRLARFSDLNSRRAFLGSLWTSHETWDFGWIDRPSFESPQVTVSLVPSTERILGAFH